VKSIKTRTPNNTDGYTDRRNCYIKR